MTTTAFQPIVTQTPHWTRPTTEPAVNAHPAAEGWWLRRRLAVVFAVLGVVIAVLIAGVVVSSTAFVSAGNSVIFRWQPLSLDVAALNTDAIDQETGVRGYLLSRNPVFLAPYDAALRLQATREARIRRLAGNDRAVRRELDAMVAAIGRWQRTIALPAIEMARVGNPSAAAVVERLSAKQAFDRIRRAAATLEATAAYRARAARSARFTAGVVAVSALAVAGLLLLAAAFLLWWGLRRWVLRPMESLGGQSRVVASGDMQRRITPAGPREIVDLGADVEAMRQRIVTELGKAEQIGAELRRQGAELARSNEDLQQFAYVASHDLSEPLRKVANFCQLLERQYNDQLDDRARQYIAFAVDGAKRMQALIADVLALSRVGRSTDSFVAVDLDARLDQALRTLGDRINAAGATIVRETALPTVRGDVALLTSMLENLVGNAVKYRRDDIAPVVRLASRHEDGRWVITVADNGIGIDAQYAERIFAVFQRLHLRDKYEGTGIGLALCRRIAEFHGGLIRLVPVESIKDGATFEITLPEGEHRA